MNENKNSLKELDVKDINLYVRFAQEGHGTTGKGYYVPWRILYDNFLLFVTKGTVIIRFETHDIPINQNELCIIPPFLKNRLIIEEDVDFQYFGIHFDFFYDDSESFNEDVYIPENLGYIRDEVVEMPKDERLIHRDIYALKNVDFPEKISITHPAQFTSHIEALVEKFDSKSFAYELFIKGKLYELLYLIITDIKNISGTLFDSENKNMSGIYKYIKSISSDYNSNIDIVDIALQFGMTPARFRAMFKTITSQTPKEYIVENKINHAKELLQSGEYNVNEVAYMLGYDDVSYFSKLFKRKIGSSPKTFIK